MCHVINKQSMHDEVGSFPFHKRCLFVVDCHIVMRLHPSRSTQMPLTCRLPSSIHSLHQQQGMCLRNCLWLPVWRANIYFFIPNFSIQKCLLGVCLEHFPSVLCSNGHHRSSCLRPVLSWIVECNVLRFQHALSHIDAD
jgi:hypothetical protein